MPLHSPCCRFYHWEKPVLPSLPFSPPARMKSQQLPLADAKPLFALVHTNKAGFRGALEIGKCGGFTALRINFLEWDFFFPNSQDGLY